MMSLLLLLWLDSVFVATSKLILGAESWPDLEETNKNKKKFNFQILVSFSSFHFISSLNR